MRTREAMRDIKHKRKCIAAAALVVVCAILASGCASGNIVVNGRKIPEIEFKAEVARRLAVIRKSNPGELKGKRGEKLKAETERQVATDLIKAELMKEQAQKLGVKLPADELNRRLEEEEHLLGSDQLEKDLKNQGLTREQYKKKVEEKALVDALGKKIGEGVSVSKDEAESYFLTHKDIFSQALMVHAQHILLQNESEADVIDAEARRGDDFATLAKSFSKDETTASNGGDMGWIESGTMEPDLQAAVFALQPGQVSGVIKASDGFHVVKVLERKEASVPAFSDVAGQAIEKLTNSKKQEKFSDWLKTAYANARVDTGGTGRWDPQLGMVVQE
jgi:foldase protein PrsA